MKLRSVLVMAILSIMLFATGYITALFTNSQTSREIWLTDHDETVIITNIADQSVVDNIIMIYLRKKQLTANINELGKPDMSIRVVSPREHTSLIDSKLQFVKDGAIISERAGESSSQVIYYSIDEASKNFIVEEFKAKK